MLPYLTWLHLRQLFTHPALGNLASLSDPTCGRGPLLHVLYQDEGGQYHYGAANAFRPLTSKLKPFSNQL